MDFILTNWLPLLLALVAFANAITNLTKTPKDNAVMVYVYKVVDFIALNWTKRSKE